MNENYFLPEKKIRLTKPGNMAKWSMNVDQSGSEMGSFLQSTGDEGLMQVDTSLENTPPKRKLFINNGHSCKLGGYDINSTEEIEYSTFADDVQQHPINPVYSSTPSVHQNDKIVTRDSGIDTSGDIRKSLFGKSGTPNKLRINSAGEYSKGKLHQRQALLSLDSFSPQRLDFSSSNSETGTPSTPRKKSNKRARAVCLTKTSSFERTPSLKPKQCFGNAFCMDDYTPKTNCNLYTPKSREVAGQKKGLIKERFKKHVFFPGDSDGRFNNEFEKIKRLGEGTFGCVYLVENRFDGCEFAIKRIVHESNKMKIKNATREVQVLSALSQTSRNKHICQYFSSWNESGSVYIQMEYCKDGSLAERIKDLKSKNLMFTKDQILHCLRHVLKALRVIHSCGGMIGLAHRDIKPENILRVHSVNVSAEEEDFPCYKLADFGHLSYADDHSGDQGDSRYLSKEAMRDDKVDKSKADIFALALTIYECGTLTDLPKGGDLWHSLRDEPLPNVRIFDGEFNRVLQSMAHLTFSERPSAQELLKLPVLFSPAKKHAYNVEVKYEQLLQKVYKNHLQVQMENSLDQSF